jgi:hypothetical protein
MFFVDGALKIIQYHTTPLYRRRLMSLECRLRHLSSYGAVEAIAFGLVRRDEGPNWQARTAAPRERAAQPRARSRSGTSDIVTSP